MVDGRAAVHDDRDAALVGDARRLRLTMPCCSQSVPQPSATAERAMSGVCSARRKTSTMSKLSPPAAATASSSVAKQGWPEHAGQPPG